MFMYLLALASRPAGSPLLSAHGGEQQQRPQRRQYLPMAALGGTGSNTRVLYFESSRVDFDDAVPRRYEVVGYHLGSGGLVAHDATYGMKSRMSVERFAAMTTLWDIFSGQQHGGGNIPDQQELYRCWNAASQERFELEVAMKGKVIQSLENYISDQRADIRAFYCEKLNVREMEPGEARRLMAMEQQQAEDDFAARRSSLALRNGYYDDLSGEQLHKFARDEWG